jgi:6-phosphofructokinase 1
MEIRDKHAPRLINKGAHRPVHPPSGAALIGQSGGPTVVINQSLVGVVQEARLHPETFTRVWGARHGVAGILRDDLLDLGRETEANLERVAGTPAAALGSVRKKPTREECLAMFETFRRRDIRYLFYIGGNDSAETANIVLECARNENYPIRVVHVPKTIDNDLPLPSDIMTFGFTTACNLGKELVRNLMQDAATTERWFFVTVMGRHAGHLALGIGGSAGATVTVIAEEFPESQISLDRLADVLEGSIIKRRAHGREQGVAILSEGLAEKLDPTSLGTVERDAYGNVRLAELDLGRLLKERVSASLKARNVDVTIVSKDMGYELRCAPPGAHDIQYCRSLGYWAVRFLMEGGSNAMVTIQAGRLVPVPFGLMMDAKTGKIRVRYADVESEMYQTLSAYMIRLKPEDFDQPETVAALARAGKLDPAEFTRRFGPLVGRA